MPSGREYHTPRPYVIPALEEDAIVRMRAPPDPSDAGFNGEEDDSEDDEHDRQNVHVGAFPAGTNYY